MSTQLPTMNCQNESPTADPRIDDLRTRLAAEGIDILSLAVAFIGGNDSLIGEVDEEHSSDIRIKNPKLLTRMTFQDRRTGEIKNELRFSDLDFVHAGNVIVRPVAFFYLRWSDDITKLAYGNAYLGFLEGAKIAKAQEAGIVVPGNVNFPQR